MKIVYYVHDLEFPLREGVRKQAWWLATAMKQRGHDVSIVSTSSRRRDFIEKEGVQITYGNPFSLRNVTADVIHYITHPTPLILPMLASAHADRQVMTMFDGNLNGFWRRIWSPLTTRFVKKNINLVTVQTDYQTSLLRQHLSLPVQQVPPLIPAFSPQKHRATQPTILVMTHLHESKGITDVIAAFKLLRLKLPQARLIIADSGLTKNKPFARKIAKMHKKNIFLKKIVQPDVELAHAWLYVYPVREPQETLSVPLSLIEAQQVGTPAIATNVGGIPEYFPHDMLVPPKNPAALAKKMYLFLTDPVVFPMKKQIDNTVVVDTFIRLYKFKKTPVPIGASSYEQTRTV